MLGPKTRLVATVHVSNMLASVTDVADLSRAVHAVRRSMTFHATGCHACRARLRHFHIWRVSC